MREHSWGKNSKTDRISVFGRAVLGRYRSIFKPPGIEEIKKITNIRAGC